MPWGRRVSQSHGICSSALSGVPVSLTEVARPTRVSRGWGALPAQWGQKPEQLWRGSQAWCSGSNSSICLITKKRIYLSHGESEIRDFVPISPTQASKAASLVPASHPNGQSRKESPIPPQRGPGTCPALHQSLWGEGWQGWGPSSGQADSRLGREDEVVQLRERGAACWEAGQWMGLWGHHQVINTSLALVLRAVDWGEWVNGAPAVASSGF